MAATFDLVNSGFRGLSSLTKLYCSFGKCSGKWAICLLSLWVAVGGPQRRSLERTPGHPSARRAALTCGPCFRLSPQWVLLTTLRPRCSCRPGTTSSVTGGRSASSCMRCSLVSRVHSGGFVCAARKDPYTGNKLGFSVG